MRINQKLGNHPPDVLVKIYTAHLLGRLFFPTFQDVYLCVGDNYFQEYVPALF